MKSLNAVIVSGVLFLSLIRGVDAAVMENGVDPANLGKGDWIYFLSSATNKLGGNVSSVTDVPSLMQFYKRSGLDFIVVKSGTGSEEFPKNSPQFTSELIDAAHAAGLKIFGYTRSDGKDVPGEIALALKNYELGADGFVIDAEAEWEVSRLENGPALAIELCEGIKRVYPNKFLGHSPFPIISYHSSFPYKEFGRYCDAVMPQAYWKSIGVTPTRMVEWMNSEWHNFHNSLTGEDQKAIKPIAPIAQGWSPSPDKVMDPDEIIEFVAALGDNGQSASPTGYKGVSYWRADLHTGGMWRAIRSATIGQTSRSITTLAKNNTKGALPKSDQPQEEYRPQKPEPKPKAEAKLKSEHKPKAEGKAAGTKTLRSEPGNEANEFVLDNSDPNVSFTGKWYLGKSKSSGYGPDYFCANTVHGDATATAVYRPLIRNEGEYDVYIRYVAHPNRSEKTPWFVSFNNGSEIVVVNQTVQQQGWYLLASRKHFAAGSDGFVSISNDTEEAGRVVTADAVRFVRREDSARGGGQ